MAVVRGPALSDRVAEQLYTEALLLADETHAYYDAVGRAERDRLEPKARVLFACEALKATTRLMHVIACWRPVVRSRWANCPRVTRARPSGGWPRARRPIRRYWV